MDPPLQLPARAARGARGARGAPERGASRSRQTAMKQAYAGVWKFGSVDQSLHQLEIIGNLHLHQKDSKG